MANRSDSSEALDVALGATSPARVAEEALAPGRGWLPAGTDAVLDLVVGIDEEFTIVYVNRATARFVGRRIHEIVGTSVVDHVHPDDLVRAAAVTAGIVADDVHDSITPANFRLRDADGNWQPVEVNASDAVDTPEGTRILLVGRRSGDRLLQDELIERLTAGASTEQLVALLPRFGLWRHPLDQFGVVWTDDQGYTTIDATDELRALIETHHDDTPWAQAAQGGEDLVFEGPDQLAEPLRSAARCAGLGPLWAMPVFDPRWRSHAVVLGWARASAPTPDPHRAALENMTRFLDLVLLWRSHHAELQRAARHDALTGLANRATFFEHLEAALGDRLGHVGVLYIDLDGFKAINDGLGHAAGDRLLIETARRLEAVVRRGDVVARLGGDEFALLCTSTTGGSDLERLADRLIAAVCEPIPMNGESVAVGASVGIAICEPGTVEADALVHAADEALYVSKRAGRGRWTRSTLKTSCQSAEPDSTPATTD